MNIDRALAISDYQCEERTAEITWLAQQAVNHRTIVEVGCWKGCTTRALADNTSGLVYAVDTWRGNTEHPEAWQGLPENSPENLFATFWHNARDLSNLTIMKETSLDASRHFDACGLRADMVFLDASHDYENVKKDILAWRPLLAMGGLLCGHDRQWDGVRQAIDELLPGHQVGAGAIWYAA